MSYRSNLLNCETVAKEILKRLCCCPKENVLILIGEPSTARARTGIWRPLGAEGDRAGSRRLLELNVIQTNALVPLGEVSENLNACEARQDLDKIAFSGRRPSLKSVLRVPLPAGGFKHINAERLGGTVEAARLGIFRRH